ncbi:dimeric dihydrodiol dehydrogenase [Penicillium hispanicum]|uniref:dimeric dihydrodiol dehydrogenase n=1 Tax=Penicillium hispanicum TaxID=1080232 RepID=UPI00253FE74F|nr:dimeric dihydrodiol dehydrogenase [Penicillium hispanicum]KAJ5570084.1 dimeric dihydrodiol dehydrogenase [Penicillium hispanicum]
MPQSEGSASEVFKLRWGIIGTGRIAETPEFAQDLLLSSSGRGVADVIHVLVGVGSSRSAATANAFLQRVNAPVTCVPFASYDDLVHSPDIDIVYIATPHSHHFPNAILALESGKHVLCEKPLTVNAAQTKILIALATQGKLFLMEGMWTRFQPIGVEIRRLVDGSEIGTVTRIFADNSLGMDPLEDFPPEDRMVRKDLAGGALLDLGIYSIHWVMQVLSKDMRYPSEVVSVVSKCLESKVDESVTIILKFPFHGEDNAAVLGVANASLRAADSYDGQTPVIRIQGDKGEIQVFGRPWCPSHLCVVGRKQGFGNVGVQIHRFENHFPDAVYGLAYEADEAARCIRDAKLESPFMPWNESLVCMEIMDKVRQDNGLDFPEEIESTL